MQQAVRYLRGRSLAESDDPFCMVVSFHHPHAPFHVRQEYWNLYENADILIPHYPDNLEETYSAIDRWANEAHETDAHRMEDPASPRRLRRVYYAALSYVDHKIGDLVEVLREAGVLENTLILFTSDHGDLFAERRMVQKRCFYEWSARIPLIIRLPAARQAGLVVDQPVSLIDILPTLLDIAGGDVGHRSPLDGIHLHSRTRPPSLRSRGRPGGVAQPREP